MAKAKPHQIKRSDDGSGIRHLRKIGRRIFWSAERAAQKQAIRREVTRP